MASQNIGLEIRAVPVVDQKTFASVTKQYQQMLNATPSTVTIRFNADTKSLQAATSSATAALSKMQKQFTNIGGMKLGGSTQAIQAFTENHLKEVRALENEYINLKTRIREVKATMSGGEANKVLNDIKVQLGDVGRRMKEVFSTAELDNFKSMFGGLGKNDMFKNMVTNVTRTQDSITGLQKRVVELAGTGEQLVRVTQQLGPNGWEVVNVRAVDNVKTLTNQINNLVRSMQTVVTGAGADTTLGVNASNIITALKEIEVYAPNARQQFEQLKTSAATLSQQFANSSGSLQQYKKAVTQLTDLRAKLNLETQKEGAENSQYVVSLRSQISALEQQAAAHRQGITAKKDAAEASAHLAQEEERLRVTTQKQNEIMKKQKNFLYNIATGMKDAAARVINYTIAYRTIWQVVSAMRDAVEQAKALNAAFTDIQMVTMQTDEATKELALTYSDLAVELSTTLTDIAQGADEWLRQGQTMADTTELLRASTVMARVGQMEDAEATEYLTSALKGYKVEAQDAMHVVDALSQVDIESASSVSDLAEAMQRSANVASTAGVDFERLIGYIGTIREVTQRSASVVGESLKTIFSRMGSVKAGTFLDEDLENEYEDVTTFANDVEKVLSKVGIKVRDTNHDFRDTQDILDDIAERWETFTDLEKNAVATAVAGTRQRENLLSLMENYDKALSLTEAAYNSSGSAMEKYNVYQQSIAAQQERITALWQTFIEKMNVGDVISDLLSVAEALMTVFSSDVTTGILKWSSAIFGAITVVKALGQAFKLTLRDLPALIALTKEAGSLSAVLSGTFSLSAISKGTWVALATIAVFGLYQILSRTIKTANELREEITGLSNEIDQAQSDISTYNSQIQENSNRIDELMRIKEASGDLSIVQQSELENLQLENKELQTNIALLQEQIDLKNQEKRKAAEELYQKNSEAIFTTNQGGWEATLTGYKGFDEVFRENVDEYNKLQQQIKDTDVSDTATLKALQDKLEQVRTTLVQNAQDAQQIIEAYGQEDPVTQSLQSSLDYYTDSLANVAEQAKEIVESAEFSDVSDELQQLAANGTLTADVLNDIRFEGIVGELEKLGFSVEDIISYFQDLADQSNVTADAVNKVSATSMVTHLEDQVGAVGDALNELNDTGYLTQETVLALMDAGYDLGDSLTLTENGYLTNRDALLALLEAKRAEYQATMNESLQAAADLVGAKIDEKESYDAVTNSILAKLEAQMAEAQVEANTKINEATDSLYNGNSQDYFKLNAEAQAAAKRYNELKNAKKNLENALANMDTYDTAVDYILNSKKSGSSGGSSGGGSSSSSSDVETAFERDIRILEHQQYLAEQWAGVYEDEAGKEAEYQAKVNEQIEIYGKLMERVHEEAEKYRAQGYDDESETIQDLQKQYWEYYNARKDLIDGLADYQKEKEEEERQAVEDALDELKDAIDDLIDDAEDRLNDLLDQYDYQIKKLEAMRDLTKSYYDTVNEVNDLQHEIDKELAKSKTQYAYLDESLRETLFNEKDYEVLSDKLQGIADECNDLYEGYLQDLSELTEEDIWKADLITAEYERQYNYKLMEYQVANAELNLIKAQTNLQNVLANRNVRMYQNGQWTWVADHEAVVDAQEELEDAKYEYKQSQIELRQQAVIDEYDAMIDSIQAQSDAAEAEFEQLKEQWEEVQDQLTTENDAMTRILEIINETNLPGFQEIINQTGDSLISLINRISSMVGGSGADLDIGDFMGGAVGGGGSSYGLGALYNSSSDYLAAAISAAKRGDLDEAQELWNRRGYKVEAEGNDRGTSQKEAWDKIMNAYNNRGSSSGGGGSSGSSSGSSSRPNYGGYDSADDFNDAIHDAFDKAASTGQNVNIGGGLYIDADKIKKSSYDTGGVLNGLGGIKATDKNETIFDPAISAKLLSPQKSREFLNSAEALTKLLDNSTGFSRLMSALTDVVNVNKGSVDSHDFVWNGSLMGKIRESDYDSISSIMRRYIPIMKG